MHYLSQLLDIIDKDVYETVVDEVYAYRKKKMIEEFSRISKTVQHLSDSSKFNTQRCLLKKKITRNKEPLHPSITPFVTPIDSIHRF